MLWFYSLRTALCESIRYQAKSEQNVRQDLIPRVRDGEAALMHPKTVIEYSVVFSLRQKLGSNFNTENILLCNCNFKPLN